MEQVKIFQIVFTTLLICMATYYYLKNKVVVTSPTLTIFQNSGANLTLTGTNTLNSVVIMNDASTAIDVNLNLPSAVDIVAGAELNNRKVVGQKFSLVVKSDSVAKVVTLVAGTGVTFPSSSATTVAAGKTQLYIIELTNVKIDEETVTYTASTLLPVT